jgi:hypothetical protein
MIANTFEFISILDWCRQASSPNDLMRQQRSFLPLFASNKHSLPAPDWDQMAQKGVSLLPSISLNIGFPLDGEVEASGSVIANLGPCLIKDSSLLVLVRENLAITEGYGDARWCNFQLRQWPYAHNLHPSFVGVDKPNPVRLWVKAYAGDDNKPIQLDRPCIYLSVRDNDRNPYHWIFETLPRLRCLSLIPELRELPLVVRSPLTELQMAFIQWMGIEQEIFVTGGRSVYCSSLFFPSIPSPPALNRDFLHWLQQSIESSLPPVSGHTRRRLYISRRDATQGRILTNEEQVIGCLARKGFESLVMSELSPLDQINAFRHAEMVVMPHGAAASYMLFAPPGCALIELHTPKLPNNLYFALTKLAGGRYGCLSGRGVGENLDFTVELEELESMLETVSRSRLTQVGPMDVAKVESDMGL